MAGLTKTYSGDLTASIVGKIWDVIKDIDDRDSKASKEVVQASKHLKRDDPGAVKVQDKFLAETVVDIFTPLDVKFLHTEGKVTGLSDKINSVAGGIVDTQKLIINQNQILEDKFDSILTAIGSKNDFIKAEDERAKYKQLSLDLTAGTDLSTTSKLLKSSRRGGGGFFWKLLFNKKVRRSLTKAILKKVLRRPRIYAKLARRTIGRKLGKTVLGRTFERVAKPVLTRQLGKNLILRALRSPAVQKALVKKLGKEGAEKLTLKLAGKAIPGANTAYGAVEGLVRGAMGDWKGMMLSFGSAIPYAGYAFSAVDLMRDIDPEAYTKHIEGNFPPSDANIAAFFQDALGVSPDQYETGTSIQPRGASGGAVGALTPILSVVKKFGADTGFGMQINSVITNAGLSGVPVENISHKFDFGNVSATKGIEKQDSAIKAVDIFSQKKGEDKKEEPDKSNPIITYIKETTQSIIESIGDTLNNAVEGTRNMIGSEADDGYFGPKEWGIKHRPDDGFIGPKEWGIPNPLNWLKRDKGSGESIIPQQEIASADPIGKSMISTILPKGNPLFTSGFRTSNRPNHHGVDYGVDAGSPVMNALDGIVTHVGANFGNHGGYIVVNDVDANGKKLSTANLYGHVKNVQVEIGDKVKQGDHLADIIYYPADPAYGKAGEDHSHLHFERFDGPGNNDQIDPIDFLKGTSNPQLQSKLAPLTSVPVASSLNSIESPTSNLVSEGSMNRQLAIKKNKKRSSIVVIANNVINSSTIHVPMGSRNGSDDPFAPINLARLG